jgi:hypothetical protein
MKPMTAAHLRHYFLLSMGLGQTVHGCTPADADGDGVVADEDCDDANSSVYPGAAEVCDMLDNNCDGIVDVDAIDRPIWYSDVDSDGFGNAAESSRSCEPPEGSVQDNTDCAPTESTIHVGATEDTSDGQDNDCDGMIDEMVCPESRSVMSAKEVSQSKGKYPLSFCVDRPDDGSACRSPAELRADRLVKQIVGSAPSVTFPGGSSVPAYWHVRDPVCGPDEDRPESCCYVFRVEHAPVPLENVFKNSLFEDVGGQVLIGGVDDRVVHGRPLTVQGVPRVATISRSDQWCGPVGPNCRGITQLQRRKIASVWYQSALYEHASVASFARFSMELMALGAPSDLVLGACHAQADEVVHARACFSMASFFAGQTLGPGAFDMDGSFSHNVTPEHVLVQTILEACINETFAAAEAAWLAEKAEDDEIVQIHHKIGIDESRHAALGWKTVRWVLQQHPELCGLASRTFSHFGESLSADDSSAADDNWVAAYGCMPVGQRGTLQKHVWKNVIAPCAETLLNASYA